MTTILIIGAIAAAIYTYAAIAFYYGFKDWYPFCSCDLNKCSPKRPS